MSESHDPRTTVRSLAAQWNQAVHGRLADVNVDDPVHQIEAYETDRKHDPRILVDVAGRDAQHLVRIAWTERHRRRRLVAGLELLELCPGAGRCLRTSVHYFGMLTGRALWSSAALLRKTNDEREQHVICERYRLRARVRVRCNLNYCVSLVGE